MGHKFFNMVVTVMLFGGMPALAGAQESPFKTYNPDVQKYTFARSYITSLGHFHKVHVRLEKQDPRAMKVSDEKELVKDFIEFLTQDNLDLRIAKNYLVKYLNSPNALIRKVSMDTIAIYDEIIASNSQERELWKTFYDALIAGTETFDKEEFAKKQLLLAHQRKELAKGLVAASVVMTKVLISEDSDEFSKDGPLAISATERRKLIEKLDTFARNDLEWGMKPGQSPAEACVANIREILEDPIRPSAN